MPLSKIINLINKKKLYIELCFTILIVIELFLGFFWLYFESTSIAILCFVYAFISIIIKILSNLNNRKVFNIDFAILLLIQGFSLNIIIGILTCHFSPIILGYFLLFPAATLVVFNNKVGQKVALLSLILVIIIPIINYFFQVEFNFSKADINNINDVHIITILICSFLLYSINYDLNYNIKKQFNDNINSLQGVINNKIKIENKSDEVLENLKYVNEDLSNFTNVISYEFKDILSKVSKEMHVLNTAEDKSESLAKIKENVNILYDKIDKIDLHETLTGNISKEMIDLNVLLKSIINDQNNKNITFDINYIFPVLYINKSKIEYIFRSIIEEAMKNKISVGKTISISWHEKENYHIFSIIENLNGVYNKNNTFSNKESLLNIALIKKIVSQYQGTFSLTNQVGKNVVSTFSLLKSKTQKK